MSASEPSPAESFRVGLGYDSHRFVPGGPLRLGGVDVPHDRSLAGHSDGDAVAHALTDAVLGAACAGDIGALFPDSDPANAGRNSLEMLGAAVLKVRALGWRVGNADVTVITEAPRVGPHRDAMRAALATVLDADVSRISIKGKSNEQMGSIGSGEGLACLAVVALVRAPTA